jgi:type II secretory pathway component PulC
MLNILLSLSVAVLVTYLFLNIKNAYCPKMQPVEQREIQLPALIPEVPVYKQDLFKTKPLFNTYVKKAQLQEKQDFILLGVSLGDKSLAMIRDVLGNKNYYCTEGDKVGVFKVKRISKDQVILESDQDTLVLTQ